MSYVLKVLTHACVATDRNYIIFFACGFFPRSHQPLFLELSPHRPGRLRYRTTENVNVSVARRASGRRGTCKMYVDARCLRSVNGLGAPLCAQISRLFVRLLYARFARLPLHPLVSRALSCATKQSPSSRHVADASAVGAASPLGTEPSPPADGGFGLPGKGILAPGLGLTVRGMKPV